MSFLCLISYQQEIFSGYRTGTQLNSLELNMFSCLPFRSFLDGWFETVWLVFLGDSFARWAGWDQLVAKLDVNAHGFWPPPPFCGQLKSELFKDQVLRLYVWVNSRSII